MESVYPERFNPAEEQPGWAPTPESEASVVEHLGTSGVVLAFDQANLVAIAERSDIVIELVPQVGDFVARGDPLFRVRNGGHSVNADDLRASVAIGPQRTMEQDPRFAFRIMVDIANKALSPAINDPTTAVLALDQIHRLLMYVGVPPPGCRPDSRCSRPVALWDDGTPDWPDFVSLAVTEIRHYGGNTPRWPCLLQAMLEHLLHVLPEARKMALQQEVSLLHCAIQRNFPDVEDRTSAQVGDLQGIGSSEPS